MGRAPCCDKANVKKGPWSPEEDAELKTYIEQHGTGGNWIALPQKIGLKRCGKSCRLRWLNYLRPNIKHGGFSEEEDRIICNLYVTIGSRWSIIAAQLPGRTDNDIKNYWNTRLKKKLLGKQRKEHASRRDSLKQEMLMKRENESLMAPQVVMNYQAPYNWLEIPAIMPPLVNQDANNFMSQESQRNLLLKVGGRFSDDDQYHLQDPDISATGSFSTLDGLTSQDQVQMNTMNMFSSSSSSLSMNSMESTRNQLPEYTNYSANAGAAPQTFQALESFPVELEAMMASYNNPQEIEGLESLYEVDMANVMSSGSSGVSSVESSSWENSLAYHQLVSEYETCLQSIRPDSTFADSRYFGP